MTLRTIFRILFCLYFISLPVYAMEQNEIDELKTQAYAYYNTNKSTSALMILDTIPDENRDEEVLLILSNIYLDMGKKDQAMALLTKSIAKNPKYYKSYYNLGCLYMRDKKYAFAIENFKKAIKINPAFAYSYYNIGCCQLELLQYSKAKTSFLKAISQKSDVKDFYVNLAYSYKMLGKEKEAKKILEVIPRQGGQ